MTTYRYINPEQTVVAVIDDDGLSRRSGLASALVPEGAGVEPYVAPVVIPSTVTMRQARLALLQSGLLAQVNDAVAGMPGADGDAARIEWEFSSTVERNRPLVQGLAATLGLTNTQLDNLFVLAGSL